MKPSKQTLKHLKAWAPYVLIPLVVYFANIEIQSYLGRQVLEESGLISTPLAQAKEQSAAQSKHILVDVSAIWCSSCRKLDKNVLSHPDVQAQMAQKYIFTRIEYESDEGKQFTHDYQVSGFPTLLILDHQGQLIRRLNTTYDPQQFIQQL